MLFAAPNNRLRYAIALAAAVVIGGALNGDASAQAGGSAMPMQHEHISAAPERPSHDDHGTRSTVPVIAAYQAVNEKMHHDMMITLTGDADRDFVAGMIPHHQGAIDMAEIVLKYGKDPKIRKLAEEIITTQQNEIAQMKAWFAQNAK